MKKFSAILLSLILVLSLVGGAYAADDTDTGDIDAVPISAEIDPALEAAAILNALGLFKGTGTDEDGNPIFALEAAPLREQALIMLTRLYGKEADALDFEGESAFLDIEEWFLPYAAYAVEQGWTKGVSEDAFGFGETATAQMYVTFVLRALGYSDSGEEADFSYDEALAFGAELGLNAESYETFLRGDIAVISLTALGLKLAGSEVTLLESLIEAGAVTQEAVDASGYGVE